MPSSDGVSKCHNVHIMTFSFRSLNICDSLIPGVHRESILCMFAFLFVIDSIFSSIEPKVPFFIILHVRTITMTCNDYNIGE